MLKLNDSTDSSAVENHLAGLWEQVLEDWDNEAVHRTFIDAARGYFALGFAASKYSGAVKDENRSETASKMLSQVSLLAEHSLKAGLTRKSPARRMTNTQRAILAVLGAVVTIFVFWLAWLR